VSRGEIYLAEIEGKTRPVVVVARQTILPYLRRVACVAVSTQPRGLHSEVSLGGEEGLERESVAVCDWLVSPLKSELTGPIGALDGGTIHTLDRALSFALQLD
jgi:mRNA interferase MazF